MSKFNKIFNKKDTEIDKKAVASIKDFSFISKIEDDTYEEVDQGQRFTVDIPEYIHQKAALISAHFVLPEGSRIVDTGCGTGQVSYVLAQLNPRIEIIGIGKNKRAVAFANKYYHLPNLKFVHSDLFIDQIDDESIDGIINSNVLYGVYSAGGYNPDEVSDMLAKQSRKLKPGGTMVIRDYLMPEEDEFVLLELPNEKSKGKKPSELSDADLLMLFSQSARPLPMGGSEGFFIEELSSRKEGTRLFRLPHKWAVEFIHHKDESGEWEKKLKTEYTFFTYKDYRREFAKMGMRVLFSGPYWNPWVMKNRFEGKFKMYTEDYHHMSSPATNYFTVAQKMSGKQSLLLEERSPSQKEVGGLHISLMRETKTGKLHEVVKPVEEICDIIPFRITPNNRLRVFVRTGVPRPIINSVPRGSANLDGKRWSGHLIEPITMGTSEMSADVNLNRDSIFEYLSNTIGLRAKSENTWYVGTTYFPAPDKIDTAIDPVFIEVENPYKFKWSLNEDNKSGFSEEGMIMELDGYDIIQASQVGLLPEPRLEMHVTDLMRRYKIEMPEWVGDNMPDAPMPDAVDVEDLDDIIAELKEKKASFVEEKGKPEQLRTVKSTFVEDGKVGSTTRGIAAKDVEFVVTSDGVENVAIVLPITRNWDNTLLVSLDPVILPVPNRRGGDGIQLNAPSFPLPKEVKNVDDAKAFVADKFSIPVSQVAQLGDSYFTHVGVTPQRIYPFMITGNIKAKKYNGLRCISFNMLYVKPADRYAADTLKLFTRIHMMDSSHSMSVKHEAAMGGAKYKGFSLATSKVAIDARSNRQSSVPSRVLGECGNLTMKAKVKHTIDALKPKHN